MKLFNSSILSSITILIFTIISNWILLVHEGSSKKDNFKNQAQLIFNQIETSMIKHQTNIASIQAFFSASTFVNSEEFKLYTQQLISENGVYIVALDNHNSIDFVSSDEFNNYKHKLTINISAQNAPIIDIPNFTSFIVPLDQSENPYLVYLISDHALLNLLNLSADNCVKLIGQQHIIQTNECNIQPVNWYSSLNRYNQDTFFDLPSLNTYYSVLVEYDLSWQNEFILLSTVVFIFTLGLLGSFLIYKHINIKQQIDLENIENNCRIAILSSINHEIRTPINSVIYFCERLKKQEALKSESQEVVENIIWSANMLNSVAENTLNYSCAEAGKLTLNNRPTNLPALLNKIKSYYSSYTFKSKKRLILHFSEEIGLINFDSPKFFQLTTNIVNNAFKYSSGAIVNCYISEVENQFGNYIRVIVQDYGKGISVNPKLIFSNPFSTTGELNKMGGQGAIGVGLYMCNKVLEGIGGKIRIRGVKNKGTIVVFRLPYTTISKKETYNRSILKGKSALIIDDDEMNLELCQRLLEELGINVQAYNSAEKALQFISNVKPNFVICDYQLPDTNGIFLIEKLREKYKLAQYFILSASDKTEIQTKIIPSDIIFMEKPFNKEDFLIFIHNLNI
ncbi:ATP-binding protein [Pseudoalteromonas sp. NBT06-2]|uniref:hybrid sensor histidine kinase/response regulator n=1 Tax=Pseudoalteromonas sp. NBT06-2 TaxID=2025950 RepID=UPI0014823428|nr:ATP-binding protein [Pseudoalteromonas sp. NBT06-2]